MEVMWIGAPDNGYPCLVEVGSRCHGGEGTWLAVAQECVGYTQVSLTVDVYTGAKHFNSIADGNHYPLIKAGRDVDMVSRHSGMVRSFPGEAAIRALPSFRTMHWECKVGDFIHKTVDCFTRPGCVQLVNESEEQADRDLETIHRLEDLQLIDYSVICPVPPVVGAVVIVDPFSTGANLAAMAASWGYRVILVFSEIDSPVSKLVAEGVAMVPMVLIQHNNRDMDKERALKETLAAIESQDGLDGTTHKSPVLAILPGAETGVELAETLAARFGTRGNGDKYTHLRRNKFCMQNGVREAGVRAVTQALCRTESEVRTFWDELERANGGQGAKCVVKPNESAGSDGVFKCETVDAALHAFGQIHGRFNGLGQLNDGALCQEFLQGNEFVVDGVSRDGVYKVTAIWEYDKRFANGANFVYFGMRLRSSLGEREKALVANAKQVVDALHIVQGPSHMEVILTPTGPCLVEVGSRCHGGEATWSTVAQECIGYTQIDTTLNCFLRPDRFDALPDTPTRLEKQGAEVFLVSTQTGTLRDIPGLNEIRGMKSFRRLNMQTQVGSSILPTVDCFTRPGAVQMVNELPGELEEDISRIREMELSEELFVLA
ncbi:ddaF [Symbiodinium microadriaticum]|nr:ddaF [Symbiodinium microadriaticum]